MSASRLAAAVHLRRPRRPLSLGRRLFAAFARYRQRRDLADLDDHLLDDIGLTRNDVDAECRKPLWR